MDLQELPIRTITPHDGTDAFRHAVSSIISNRRFSSELAWRMFLRDTKAAFRGSFLGWLWIIMPTLANSLVWIFLSSSDVVTINTGGIPYPLFVITGNLLWTAFSGCLLGGLSVLNEAQGTLSKVNFPHESLLLVVIYKSLLNSGITLLTLPFFFFIYPINLPTTAILFPLGLLLTMICGLSLGLLIMPVAALFQDLSRGVHLGMRFAFFVTPVVFPLPSTGIARAVMLWNPATYLIVTSRSWLLGGEETYLGMIILVGFLSVFMLSIGIVAMKVSLPHIIERTGGG
jgi:lipopolysaccharide transport system permease protein